MRGTLRQQVHSYVEVQHQKPYKDDQSSQPMNKFERII